MGELLCAATGDIAPGSGVVVMVRPESIVLHDTPPPDRSNVVEGKVATVMFLGQYLDCTVELGKSLLQTYQRHSLPLRRGDRVWVELPPGDCLVLNAED
jgi:ABC-type Fe3+/spermidine/putrescine transport system ATPase subunit